MERWSLTWPILTVHDIPWRTWGRSFRNEMTLRHSCLTPKKNYYSTDHHSMSSMIFYTCHLVHLQVSPKPVATRVVISKPVLLFYAIRSHWLRFNRFFCIILVWDRTHYERWLSTKKDNGGEEEDLNRSSCTGWWRTDTWNSEKRHNKGRSGVDGHLDLLSEGRYPKDGSVMAPEWGSLNVHAVNVF